MRNLRNEKAFVLMLTVMFLGIVVLFPGNMYAGVLSIGQGVEGLFSDIKETIISIGEILFTIAVLVGAVMRGVFGMAHMNRYLGWLILCMLLFWGADLIIGDVESAVF